MSATLPTGSFLENNPLRRPLDTRPLDDARQHSRLADFADASGDRAVLGERRVQFIAHESIRRLFVLQVSQESGHELESSLAVEVIGVNGGEGLVDL